MLFFKTELGFEVQNDGLCTVPQFSQISGCQATNISLPTGCSVVVLSIFLLANQHSFWQGVGDCL